MDQEVTRLRNEPDSRVQAVVQRAAIVSLVVTVGLVALKLVAASMSRSVSVLAEALQSLLDVAMSGLTAVTVRYSMRPADDTHPYGHGKAELLSSAFQMVVVVFTAAVIAWQASMRFHSPQPIQIGPGVVAMAAAVVTNIAMIGYLRAVGRKHGSTALIGEAEHLRGDTLASAGILVGLLAYQLTNWSPLDPIVAIAFTILGAIFAVRQLVSVIHDLMDGALPPAEIAAVETALREHPEVRDYHLLRTRKAGKLRVVSLHVLLDDELSFVVAHDIAEEVESGLSNALGGALVTVHYEPYRHELEHQRKEH